MNLSYLTVDIVIAAIGIVPAVKLLLDAGAEGGNGVPVDAFGWTTLEDVHAVGDCALHPNPMLTAIQSD